MSAGANKKSANKNFWSFYEAANYNRPPGLSAEKDLNDIYEYLCDEEIMRFEPYNALSFEETKKSLEWRISSDEIFAIELKSLQNDWKRLSWETRM